MGGLVTVYSGLSKAVPAVGGIEAISSNETPAGIIDSMPRIGGIPPNPLDINDELVVEEDDELNDDIDDIFMEELVDPLILRPPMSPIILLIMLSISRLGIIAPSPKPGIMLDMRLLPPPGIPPDDEDIIVDEEEEDELDLKLEMVLPSGDWVTAARL